MSDILRVIHIHTDVKFISFTSTFEGEYFENQNLFIGNSKDYNRFQNKNIIFFKNSPKSVNKIIEFCRDADLVVLYDLDFIKCKIALGLPGRTKLAWRFFGYELYQKELHLYLSTLTQRALLLNKIQIISKFLCNTISYFKTHFKWGFYSKSYFEESVSRINFFLCNCKEEYDYLITRWGTLPIFIKWPVAPSYGMRPEFNLKEKRIIIGNNINYYNNNLDIIEIIDACEKHDQYRFLLLFSYGIETNYSKKVRDSISGKNYYTIIDDFLPIDKLKEIYQKSSAAVFNGYRQMAMGNIYLSLQYGVKLYLNNKNIIMKFLRNEGFIIYSIEDLAQDLENGNISLTVEDRKYNIEKLQKMIKSYTREDFQISLYSLIKNS